MIKSIATTTPKPRNTLFGKGCRLILREAQKYYPEIDLSKAANGKTSSEAFKEQLFTIYNKLVDQQAIVEAYCLLRMAFGQISSQDLIELHRENRLFTERDAYQCAKHDEDLPF